MASLALWKPNCAATYNGYALQGARLHVQDWSVMVCVYTTGSYNTGTTAWVPYTADFESGGGMTEAQLNALLAKLDEVKTATTTGASSTVAEVGTRAVEVQDTVVNYLMLVCVLVVFLGAMAVGYRFGKRKGDV